MLFLTMTGRREEDTIQEETPDSIEEESPETEKREERQRLEKLLSKYKETFMDSTSYSSSSMNSFSGLRRNATLRGRMIKRVPCPIAPSVPSAPLGSQDKKQLLYHSDQHHHHPDQVQFQQQHHQQHSPLGPIQLPSSLQSVSSGSKNSSLVSLDIHANSPSNNNNNQHLHRYSCISSSTASSSSDRSEETEMVESWLSSIHFDEYTHNFVDNGYDLPTISRMTPEDLIAIGITNPLHRKAIKHEISGLNVSDGIPKQIPESLYEWLYLLRLEEYFDLLQKQGYDSIDKVSQLMWEDFEEIGIKKLGHQKRLSLGIKRCNNTSASGNNNAIVGVSRGNFAGVASSTTSSGYPDTVYGCIGSMNVNNNINHQNNQSNNGSITTSGSFSGGSFPDLTSCPSQGSMISRPSSQLHNHYHLSQQQHPHFSVLRPLILANNENNFTDFEGTATLQRHQRAAIVSCSASFFNKPVAMIAAKTRGSSSPGSTIGSDSQSLQFDLMNEIKAKQSNGHQNAQNCNGFAMKNADDFQGTLTGSASISSLHSAGSGSFNSYPDDPSSMYMSRHNYASLPSYDSSSSIYATLKRNKKPPPPPPKRTNSMKTSLGSSPSLSSNTFGTRTTVTTSSINGSTTSSGFYSINNDNQYTSTDERDHQSSQRSSSTFQAPSHLSMNSHRSVVDNFQDQAFATCVKSLTSRFSQMSTSQDHEDLSPLEPPPEPAPACPALSSFAPLQTSSNATSMTRHAEGTSVTSGSLVLKNDFGGSSDFPPPPTPLCQSLEELRGDHVSFSSSQEVNQSYKTYPEQHHRHSGSAENNCSFEDNSSNSSSSNESLPFANDKVGTIRQSTSNHSYHLNCLNASQEESLANSNGTGNCKHVDTIDSLVASLQSEKEGSLSFPTSISASNKIHLRRNIPESGDAGNVVIDDIETMLANLSNQLDAMLEQEIITPSLDHHGHL